MKIKTLLITLAILIVATSGAFYVRQTRIRSTAEQVMTESSGHAEKATALGLYILARPYLSHADYGRYNARFQELETNQPAIGDRAYVQISGGIMSKIARWNRNIPPARTKLLNDLYTTQISLSHVGRKYIRSVGNVTYGHEAEMHDLAEFARLQKEMVNLLAKVEEVSKNDPYSVSPPPPAVSAE